MCGKIISSHLICLNLKILNLEVEEAKEDVLEYDCCDEEFPTSLQATESPETIGDALQSQSYADAPIPSAAVNNGEKIVEKSGIEDLGARTPIGVSGMRILSSIIRS